MKRARSILNENRVRRLLEPVFDELGTTNRERLKRVLPLLGDGRAKMSECLKEAFPGMNQESAQAQFRNFRKAVNDAARAADVGIVFQCDSSKRTPAEGRLCWFEGDASTAHEIETFSRQGTSGGTSLPVENRGLITNWSSITTGSEPIRIFLSYSHEERGLAVELADRITQGWRAMSDGNDKVPEIRLLWADWDLSGGEKWNERLANEMQSAPIGLFLFSRPAQGSKYINDTELPHFQSEEKRLIPVRFGPLLEDAPNLKQIRANYQFVEIAGRKSPLSYLDVRRDHNLLNTFIELVLKAIEKAIVSLRSANVGEALPSHHSVRDHSAIDTKNRGEEFSEPMVAPSRGIELEEFSRSIGGKQERFYEHSNAAEFALRELERQDLDKNLPPGRVGPAVEILEDWALHPESTPFYAVLGEFGIGKTTTLKELTRRLLNRREQKKPAPLPIFIDLRLYYNDPSGRKVPTLETLLSEVVRHHWQGDRPELTPGEIIDAVQNEGALIIFDGLDEKMVHYSPSEARQFLRELWRVLPPRHDDPIEAKSFPKEKDERKRGKVIFSCRSHFFRDTLSQTAMLTGEYRDGIKPQDYGVCIILPFTEAQIHHYLSEILGGEEHANDALKLFASIHNLNDLTPRPFLLELICSEIDELERRRNRGDIVTGASLYELIVGRWLGRDDPKHTFTHAHKLLMMEYIAADLTASGARAWSWEKTEKWLTKFLHEYPEIGSSYRHVIPEVLNEDFRTATFVLRPDDSKDHFRFAHSSLQEFFHARYLVRALEEGNHQLWEIHLPSVETLDFVGQLLAAESSGNCVRLLEACLTNGEPRSALVAFRYWLLAAERGYPQPSPDRPNLSNLDLDGWQIRGIRAREVDLSHARLDRARFDNVQMPNANLSNSSFRLTQFESVDLRGSNVLGADFTGATFRKCVGVDLLGKATWYDCDWILSDLTGTDLGSTFDLLGTTTHCEDGLPRFQDTDSFREAELVLLSGHYDPVIACAWSADGKQLLSGSGDGRLRVWDARSGKCLQMLGGHEGGVSACAWSADGERVLSGSREGTLRVWEVRTGNCLQRLRGHKRVVRACAWAPDDEHVLSGSADGTLRVWEVGSGKCVQILKGHESGVRACAWSADGKRVLTGAWDGTLRVWEVRSGKCVRTLKGHEREINACAWSAGEERVLSASDDRTLRVWEVGSGKCVQTLTGHNREVNACAWSPDGEQVLSGSSDETLRVWEVWSGKCVQTFAGHERRVSACAWSTDGKQVLSGSDDGTLRVWEVGSGSYVQTLKGHKGEVSASAWSLDGAQALSGSDDGTLRVWEVRSGKCVQTLKGHEGGVRACAWSADGKKLLSGAADGKMRVWDVQSGECLHTLKGHEGGVTACAWSPDGKQVLSGSSDGRLRAWELQSGKCQDAQKGHNRLVSGFAWSADGEQVLSGSEDGKLLVWTVRSWECVQTLKGPESGVSGFALSADGKQVLCGSNDGSLGVLNVRTGGFLQMFQGHEGLVRACAWSIDGRQVLSGSWDGTLKVWDVMSGKCLQALKGHEGGVIACAWSVDGEQLLSGSTDGTLRVWDAKSGRPLRAIAHLPSELAALDLVENRILWSSPGAWRHLGWRFYDNEGKRLRILPAEFFEQSPT